MYISTPPSPEVENFQIKIYYPAGDWTPDLLNQRQTCYYLSAAHQLENQQLPSEETTLNFQYWDVSTCKPSPEASTTICSPWGLGPGLQKDNVKWRWSPEHLSPATAGLSIPCVLGLSPAGSSSTVHGRGCCKKRHPNIERLKWSLWNTATDYSSWCFA